MTLPASFLARPIAHRGLHDRAKGRAENSIRAFKAAIDAGYGIELDVQPSRDGTAMVFHDYDMARLTGQKGPIAMVAAADLGVLPLLGDGDGIPTLAQVLDLVAGRVPLLIEVKDQDGTLGPNVGPLEAAVADALQGYRGDAAVMSFNPHSVKALQGLLPDTPRGLVTAAYGHDGWETIPAARRDSLRDIPDYTDTGACFVSHEAADLTRPRIAELKQQGAHILCWTIRSAAAEAQARKIADNVTFEGYLA